MMEENKKINSEVEGKKNPITGFFKKFKLKRKKLIKNQALLKRGSYSLVITVMVIVAAIVVNIVTGALNDRFVLEFDMTADKNNSINIDNIEFIKNIKDKVNITVCSAEENYSSYMGYFAQQYNVNDEEAYAGRRDSP